MIDAQRPRRLEIVEQGPDGTVVVQEHERLVVRTSIGRDGLATVPLEAVTAWKVGRIGRDAVGIDLVCDDETYRLRMSTGSARIAIRVLERTLRLPAVG